MPNWEVVDDADRQVAYSSGWSILRGSTRQWEQAVHSTSQTGATATFMFKGRAVFVVATIPAGSGTSRSQYSVDGSPPTLITLQAGSQDSYGVRTFLVEGLAAGVHTIVVSNQGGSVPFQLDKFQYLPHDSDPDPSPIYPGTSSAPEPVPEPQPAESPNSSPPVPTSTKTTPDNLTNTPNNPPAQQSQQPPPTSQSSPPDKEPVSLNIPSDILSPPPSSPTPDTAESLNLGEDRVLAVVISNNNGISTMIISNKAELDRLSTMTVMKVLPSFTLITRTDSTGGVTVETKVPEPSVGALAGPSLSINEVIGISLGCLAFLGFSVTTLIFLLRRRRVRTRRAEHGKRSESRTSFSAETFDVSDENAGPSTISTFHITPRTTENLPFSTHEAGPHRRSTDDGGQSALGPLITEASSFYSLPRNSDPPPAYRPLYGRKESL